MYPQTSREIQGDYHQLREKGWADVIINPKEKYRLEKNYFDSLEGLKKPYEVVTKNDNMMFIHAQNDKIAPIEYIEDFISTLRKREHKGALELKKLEGVRHMHHFSSYSQDYLDQTIIAISRDLIANILLRGGINVNKKK